jgi:hypothetical protein
VKAQKILLKPEKQALAEAREALQQQQQLTELESTDLVKDNVEPGSYIHFIMKTPGILSLIFEYVLMLIKSGQTLLLIKSSITT